MQSRDLPQDEDVFDVLQQVGFGGLQKISDALLGSVWKGFYERPDNHVVVKAASKYLHRHSMIIRDGKKLSIHENIVKEKDLLKYLCEDSKCPESIIRFMDFFETQENYYLVLEHGGLSLFDFIVKAHEMISAGRICMSEWHRLVKILFKQMVESVDYLHSKDIVHFDLSLENYLISQLQIQCMDEDSKYLRFCTEANAVKIKLIDFGLAERFNENVGFESNKHCGKLLYQSPEITAAKKTFDAKKNDIWCLGITLFMMITGASPWSISSGRDKDFARVMAQNGDITGLMQKWQRLHYVDKHLVDLFRHIFKYEEWRCDLSTIKNHQWLKD